MGGENKSPGAVGVPCGDDVTECLLPDHCILGKLVNLDRPSEITEKRDYVVPCLGEPWRVHQSRVQKGGQEWKKFSPRVYNFMTNLGI